VTFISGTAAGLGCCEGWNFPNSDQCSSKPVPEFIQKRMPAYFGKHSFSHVTAEAELISETASKAVKVICQSFIRSYLSV